MGSSSSKVARGAARQYPSRSPRSAVSQASSRPKPVPRAAAHESKDEAIRADSADPDIAPGGFSQRLHQMGIAEPNPTYSPSSIASADAVDGPYAPPQGPAFPSARNNTTLSVLEARRRLQISAEEDFEAVGRASSTGRRFVDVRTMVEALKLRERGMPTAEIEKKLSLQPNLLGKLGRPGVLAHATDAI